GRRAESLAGDGRLQAGLSDRGADRADLRRGRRRGRLPDGDGVRGKGEGRDRSAAHGDAGAAEESGEVVGVAAGGERGIETGDAGARRLVLVDGGQHDVVEELALEDVDVAVDPTLLSSAVRQRRIRLPQRGQAVDQTECGGGGAERRHHRAV